MNASSSQKKVLALALAIVVVTLATNILIDKSFFSRSL